MPNDLTSARAASAKARKVFMQLRPGPFPVGLRVTHSISNRAGLVVGRGEPQGLSFSLYPVMLEGMTRTELWPEHQIIARPAKEQFAAHGGSFTALPGYPLYLNGKPINSSSSTRRPRS